MTTDAVAITDNLEKELKELISGIGIVIDDKIFDAGEDQIKKIIEKLEEEHISFVKYTKLPIEEQRGNLYGASFVILDWELWSGEEVGAPGATTMKEHAKEENAEFIKCMKNDYFCPVFIFSNASKDEIEDFLKSKSVDMSMVFVKPKSELVSEGLDVLDEVTKWFKENPDVYVLKKWERNYRKAKSSLFKEFSEISSRWTEILWETYGDDGVDASEELHKFILKNVETRCALPIFNQSIIMKDEQEDQGTQVDENVMQKVLEGQYFVKNEYLNSNQVMTGDIFEAGDEFFINIRPACDCIVRGDNTADTKPTVYLLKGEILPYKDAKKQYEKKYGLIRMKDISEITLPIRVKGEEGTFEFIEWHFKNIYQKEYDDTLKQQRIGRLLSPYIDRLQQRHSLHIQRQGMPRIPKKLFSK